MGEIKWIKLSTDIFNNRKIRQIECMPDGDTIIVIWFKILALAGEINDSGQVYLTKEIPYTEQLLATQFNRPIATVRLALQTFQQFGMIEIIDNLILISNWEKYQNIEGMERVREQTRLRVARCRENKRLQMPSQICQYCGGVATGYDHILAQARGGTDDPENLVPCCKACNQIKNDKPVVDFLNNYRGRIRDDIVTANENLRRYVTLCNATNRYIVTQRNAGEEEKEKDKEYKERDREKEKPRSRFTPPTVEQVREYCKERNNSVDAERFVSFYQAKGWLVGKSPMKDWKAAVRNWERPGDDKGRSVQHPKHDNIPSTYNADDFFAKAIEREYGRKKDG